jgi:hypothetical protein
MKGGDEAMFRRNHKYRNTIRGGNTKKDAGLATHKAICLRSSVEVAFLVDNENVVSVYLFQRVEREGFRVECRERKGPIVNPLRETMNEAWDMVPSVRL